MENKNKIYDCLIIGGGASGMMTAAIASAQNKSVLVVEKNKSLGEKLKITGGGRCNITNAEEDIHILLSHYGEAKQFLYGAFSQFGTKDTFSFFEKRGLPLVVQARKRAFPNTEKAVDVYNVLKKEIDKNKVETKTNTTVYKIVTKGDFVECIETSNGTFYAKSFVLALGGPSHPETGATSDGFNFLKDLGHKVKDPTASIVPLEVADDWVKMLAGVSLSFMKITFFLEDKKSFSKTGKILFTHFGLSGPLILNSASRVSDLLQSGKVTAFVDAYPDTSHGALEEKILKVFDNNKNKILKTVFKEIVPEGMHKALESLLSAQIDFTTKVHSVKKDDRKKIVHILKALPISITNLMGYDRAVVCDGGVDLQQIDMKTMRSLLFKNLYVTGDLLDINRPSGGYGLQLCWTTGYVAGINI